MMYTGNEGDFVSLVCTDNTILQWKRLVQLACEDDVITEYKRLRILGQTGIHLVCKKMMHIELYHTTVIKN